MVGIDLGALRQLMGYNMFFSQRCGKLGEGDPTFRAICGHVYLSKNSSYQALQNGRVPQRPNEYPAVQKNFAATEFSLRRFHDRSYCAVFDP
jgi:hypothetical protein